jgi:hypothetical protein
MHDAIDALGDFREKPDGEPVPSGNTLFGTRI